jgi:hypothetical protein
MLIKYASTQKMTDLNLYDMGSGVNNEWQKSQIIFSEEKIKYIIKSKLQQEKLYNIHIANLGFY